MVTTGPELFITQVATTGPELLITPVITKSGLFTVEVVTTGPQLLITQVVTTVRFVYCRSGNNWTRTFNYSSGNN